MLTLEVLTLVMVAIATALALAHALELPGKLRLTKDEYLAMQPIYYPGFTIAGIAEPLSLLLLAVLMVMTPAGSTAFALTVAAFVALAAMHIAYWLLTHPVNNFWLKDMRLRAVGRGFFALDPLQRSGTDTQPDWMHLRNRWEFSHVVRAALGLAGLVLIATAVAV
jgi:hypothetical protein